MQPSRCKSEGLPGSCTALTVEAGLLAFAACSGPVKGARWIGGLGPGWNPRTSRRDRWTRGALARRTGAVGPGERSRIQARLLGLWNPRASDRGAGSVGRVEAGLLGPWNPRAPDRCSVTDRRAP